MDTDVTTATNSPVHKIAGAMYPARFPEGTVFYVVAPAADIRARPPCEETEIFQAHSSESSEFAPLAHAEGLAAIGALFTWLGTHYDLDGVTVRSTICDHTSQRWNYMFGADPAKCVEHFTRELYRAALSDRAPGPEDYVGWLRETCADPLPPFVVLVVVASHKSGLAALCTALEDPLLYSAERQNCTVSFLIGTGKLAVDDCRPPFALTHEGGMRGCYRFDGAAVTSVRPLAEAGFGRPGRPHPFMTLMASLGRAAFISGGTKCPDYLSAQASFTAHLEEGGAVPLTPWTITIDRAKEIVLPPQAQAYLWRGFACVCYWPWLKSWYLYVPETDTKGWQAALLSCEDVCDHLELPAAFPLDGRHGCQNLGYSDAASATEMTFIAAAGRQFAISRDRGSSRPWWRCRPICVKPGAL